MPHSDHPGHPGHPPDHRTTQPPTGGIREAGLRRLSALTAAAAVAAVAATGVVAVAAYHASRAAGQDGAVGPSSAGVLGDTTDDGDRLGGPDQAPRRGSGPPAGVSSGS